VERIWAEKKEEEEETGNNVPACRTIQRLLLSMALVLGLLQDYILWLMWRTTHRNV